MSYSNYPGEYLKIIITGKETLYSQQLIVSQGWNRKAIATNHLEIRFLILEINYHYLNVYIRNWNIKMNTG